MTKITKYIPGTFCWETLYTPDVLNATMFYQSLFDWKVDKQDTEGPFYSHFLLKGKEVCGIYDLNENLQRKKTKAYWRTYISVENIDDFIKIAKATGAAIIEPAHDLGNSGRSALIQDPTGGVFSIWEPHKKIGSLLADIPGTAFWRELETPNVDIAGKFYATTFSWDPRPEKFGDMAYITFKVGKKSICGMINASNESNSAFWLTYWNVKHCEKCLNKVDKLGGKILKSNTMIKGVGQYAVLSDPQGATFAVLQPEKI